MTNGTISVPFRYDWENGGFYMDYVLQSEYEHHDNTHGQADYTAAGAAMLASVTAERQHNKSQPRPLPVSCSLAYP